MGKVTMVLFFLCSLFFSFPSFAADKITVFAAASTSNMMDEVLEIFNGKGGNATGSYAGSGTLAKQIASGAPAAIFISANEEWADYIDSEGLTELGYRKNLLGNSLVMIGGAKSNIQADLSQKPDLVKILNGEKIVIGAPESVPAGKYAKDAFINLGMWDSLQKNIAAVENVRVALAFVSRNEAPLGVVFATDAAADQNVKIISKFPAGTHKDISYPILVIKGKMSQEVKRLYDFLLSDEAKKVYKKYGFTAL